MRQIQIKITGRVQGVFYRASAKREALTLGLAGFARNEPDGSVLIEAAGDYDQLHEFVGWCRQGTPESEVASVTVTEQPSAGHVGFRTL